MYTTIKFKRGAAVYTLKVKGDLRKEDCQFDVLHAIKKLLISYGVCAFKYRHIELTHLSPKGRRGGIKLMTLSRGKHPAEKISFTAVYSDEN